MSETETLTKPRTDEQQRTEPPRQWNVVLLNDDDHTYAYVVQIAQTLFGHTPERATVIARKVDKEGRAICLTTHREHAELKCEQIHAFGRDPRLPECKGSMSAIVEPAEFDGEAGDGDGSGGQGSEGGTD